MILENVFATPLVFRATNISSLSEKRVLCTFSRSFKRSFIAGVTHPSRCSKVSADVLETGGSASDVTETLDFSGHFSSFFALSVFFLSLCFVRHFFVPRARGFAINNCCGRSAPCGRVCTFCFFFSATIGFQCNSRENERPPNSCPPRTL